MDRFIIHSKDQGGKKIRKLSHISHDFFVTLKTVKTIKHPTLPMATRPKKLTVSHQCYASYQWEENAAHLGRFLGISSDES